MRWTEEDMENVLQNLQAGISLRKTAKLFGIPESTIRHRLLKSGSINYEKFPGGRVPKLGRKFDKKLANCIQCLVQNGFSITTKDMMNAAQNYIKANNLEEQSKHEKLHQSWAYKFMKRNKISLKKSILFQQSQKDATADPFVVNYFYDALHKIIQEKSFASDQIWIVYESGLPYDPKKCQVTGPEGKTSYEVNPKQDERNHTILACCNAAGHALPPMIIFRAESLLPTWKGSKDLRGTSYATSRNGKMDNDILHAVIFKLMRAAKQKPILVMVDGHLSQITGKIIDIAIKNDVMLLKIPSHSPGVLQPLDLSCFKLLAANWHQVLARWGNISKGEIPLKKKMFVDELCRIWLMCFTKSDIQNGFTETGLFPVNKDKYSKHCFYSVLLKQSPTSEEEETTINLPKRLLIPEILPKEMTDAIDEVNIQNNIMKQDSAVSDLARTAIQNNGN